jgi:hypothetical protein
MFEDTRAREQVKKLSDDVHHVFDMLRSDKELAFRLATIGGKIGFKWNLFKLKNRANLTQIELDITPLWEELHLIQDTESLASNKEKKQNTFGLKETFLKLLVAALHVNEAIEFVMNDGARFAYGAHNKPNSQLEKARIMYRTEKVVLVRGALTHQDQQG